MSLHLERKNVVAGFSLRQHRLKTCATKNANEKGIPDIITGLLAIKLPLRNE
jgi:hypothetical protein